MNTIDWGCLYCQRINPINIYSCAGCGGPRLQATERGIRSRKNIIECPDPQKYNSFIEIGFVPPLPEPCKPSDITL